MDMQQPIVKLKLDVIFKRVFGDEKNEDIIAAMISALLEIPRETIRKIEIQNVELPPEEIEGKFSRLDMKLNVDDQTVNVEMQINYEPDFRERTLFYWSKMYGGDLKSGNAYGDLKKTYCVNIINFNMFDCEDYHSNFVVMEKSRHEVLTDKLGIHFFELKKLNNVRKNQAMEDWLHLINAETEGDLMAIQQTTAIPEVKKTIVMLRHLSADEKVRQEAYYREKRMHDEENAIIGSRREGFREGKAAGLAEGKAAGLAEGKAAGLAEGKAAGLAEGKAAGRAEVKQTLMEKWRAKGMTEEEISDLLSE